MYLAKVILENFQSHKLSEFILDSHLNIIIGISNAGKTSISRALSLVLFNKWDKSWVKYGEKFCRITVTTSTGIEIVREKGDKTNKYILRLPNQIEQVYENFGINVPQDVQKALGIYEVQIDSTENLNLNLSSQLDNLFLLSQTGSYRAKVLGKLSGAAYLDFAIREINREKRGTVVEKTLKEKELLELQQQVDKLSPVENLSISIQEIKAKLASLETQEARLEAIRSLFRRVIALKQVWVRETAKEAVLNEFDVSILSKLSDKVDKLSKIYTLSGSLGQWKVNFNKQNAIESLLASISLNIIPDREQKVERNKILRELVNKIVRNDTEVDTTSKILKEMEQKHEEVTKQYNDTLKAAGICPICGVSTKDLTNV